MENLEELEEYSKEGYKWVVFNDDGLLAHLLVFLRPKNKP